MFGFKHLVCQWQFGDKSTSMAASLINLARRIGMALSVEASSNLGIEQVPWQLPYVDCWAKHWALQAAVSLRLCQADGKVEKVLAEASEIAILQEGSER